MSVEEAVPFFAENKKITEKLNALLEVGLPYISLGQPLSTFSGGERQRVKLAQNIKKKGNIYILDESTTGLHVADIEKVVDILESIVERGNTVVEIVFTGTPKEMVESADTITAKYLRK